MTQTHQQDGEHNHASHSKHDHGDAGHQHSHGADTIERRLIIALAILGSFTLVEAVGAYFANSIAVLAEAAHMLTDSASCFSPSLPSASVDGRPTRGEPTAIAATSHWRHS